MSEPTYGDHAERTAMTLVRLIGVDELPTEPVDVTRLLQCREVLIDSLTARLDLLVHEGPTVQISGKRRDTGVLPPDLGDLVVPSRAVTRLGQVLEALPRQATEDRVSPMDALDGRQPVHAVELWRTAAAQSLAATHALATAAEPAWRDDDGAAWWVLRDIAQATEAVTVLDADLEQVGILNDLEHPSLRVDPAVARLVTSHCARVASWSATTDVADLAAPKGDRVVLGPVRVVTSANEFPLAARQLAGYLKVRNRGSYAGPAEGEPAIALDAARAVLASQRRSVAVATEWAGQLSDCEPVRGELENMGALLDDLAEHLPKVREVTKQRPQGPAMMQAMELNRAVDELWRRGRLEGTPPLSHRELASWTESLHRVNVSLGTGLRRELIRGNTNLRYIFVPEGLKSEATGSKQPLTRAAFALASAPAPALPVNRWIAPTHRTALAQTLDATPSPGARAPERFPRTRRTGVER